MQALEGEARADDAAVIRCFAHTRSRYWATAD